MQTSEVKQLVNEGYNCNVFQLSGVSNSEEEIFQTYIGPFNKLEENLNQYLKSSEGYKILEKLLLYNKSSEKSIDFKKSTDF